MRESCAAKAVLGPKWVRSSEPIAFGSRIGTLIEERGRLRCGLRVPKKIAIESV
jgi:hypothetical protein